MEPVISVIVPVYNVEKYIANCLDSLLDQGLSDNEYEIIIVNDGSIDHSFDICNKYREEHSNIFIYSQENQGVSVARNFGLGKSKGEWVMFVDSDDYVCREGLFYLLRHYCSDEYDGIRFWTRIRKDSSVDREQDCEGEVKFTGTGYEYIETYGLETFCITILYRRSFLESNNIKFSPYRIGEDFLFASHFLLANPRICSTSSIVYQYLIHPNSASTSRDKIHAKRCAYDHLEVNKVLVNTLQRYKLRESSPKVYEKSIETIQSKMLLIFSRLLSSDISLEEFKQIVKEQKEKGILPVKDLGDSLKMKISCAFINCLATMTFIYYPAKFMYIEIFVPYILPKLDRNN